MASHPPRRRAVRTLGSASRDALGPGYFSWHRRGRRAIGALNRGKNMAGGKPPATLGFGTCLLRRRLFRRARQVGVIAFVDRRLVHRGPILPLPTAVGAWRSRVVPLGVRVGAVGVSITAPLLICSPVPMDFWDSVVASGVLVPVEEVAAKPLSETDDNRPAKARAATWNAS